MKGKEWSVGGGRGREKEGGREIKEGVRGGRRERGKVEGVGEDKRGREARVV